MGNQTEPIRTLENLMKSNDGRMNACKWISTFVIQLSLYLLLLLLLLVCLLHSIPMIHLQCLLDVIRWQFFISFYLSFFVFCFLFWSFVVVILFPLPYSFFRFRCSWSLFRDVCG